ncbi:unnamed protein product [Cutaneotrichosporon oleaginosum]
MKPPAAAVGPPPTAEPHTSARPPRSSGSVPMQPSIRRQADRLALCVCPDQPRLVPQLLHHDRHAAPPHILQNQAQLPVL